MNLGVLGSLLVKIEAEGAEDSRKQMEGMQESTKQAGDEAKRSVPVLERMGKRWASVLTLVATSGAVAFGLIAKSSPAIMGSLKGIQLAFESIFMVIGDELAPVFETFEGILWSISTAFDELPGPVKTFIAGIVGAGIVVAALAAGFVGLSSLAPIVTGAITALGVSLGTVAVVLGAVIVAVAALYVAWKYNLFGIRDTAYKVFNWLKERWSSLMDILFDENMTTWEKIKSVVRWAIATIRDVLSGYLTFCVSVMDRLFGSTVEKFTAIKNFIIGAISAAYDYVMGKLNSLTSALSGVLSKISGVFSGRPGSAGGTDRTQYDSSGRVALRQKVYATRALGGPVLGGMSYLVGENGPELFTPKLSGSITPNKQTQQTLSQPSQRPIELNATFVAKLDGRTVWESVRKYSAAEMRRLGG
jgi:phage-related protein